MHEYIKVLASFNAMPILHNAYQASIVLMDQKHIPPYINTFYNTFYTNDVTGREAFLCIY